MADEYSAYLDYKEIRRRVERRLKQGTGLLAHVILYLLAVVVVVLSGTYLNYSYFSVDNGVRQFYEVYVNPGIGIPFVLWSLVLLFHALRVYRKSGADGDTREQAVETELRARLAADDTTLLADRRQSFRVHSLMVEDILARSGRINSLMLVAVVNAVVWLAWALAGARTPYAWLGAVLIAPVVLLPLLALNSHARRRQEKKVMYTLENWQVPPHIRPKRQSPDYAETDPPHLADDGELVEWDNGEFYGNDRKAKRSRS